MKGIKETTRGSQKSRIRMSKPPIRLSSRDEVVVRIVEKNFTCKWRLVQVLSSITKCIVSVTIDIQSRRF